MTILGQYTELRSSS